MNEIQGRPALFSILGQMLFLGRMQVRKPRGRPSLVHLHHTCPWSSTAGGGVREQMHTSISLIVTVYD